MKKILFLTLISPSLAWAQFATSTMGGATNAWGSGLWGTQQACPYQNSVNSQNPAAQDSDDVKDLLDDEKDAKADLKDLQKEKKTLGKDLDTATRALKDSIGGGAYNIALQYMQGRQTCNDLPKDEAPDSKMRSACSNSPGVLNATVCDPGKQMDACRNALNDYPQKWSQSQDLDSRIAQAQDRLKDLKEQIKDARKEEKKNNPAASQTQAQTQAAYSAAMPMATSLSLPLPNLFQVSQGNMNSTSYPTSNFGFNQSEGGVCIQCMANGYGTLPGMNTAMNTTFSNLNTNLMATYGNSNNMQMTSPWNMNSLPNYGGLSSTGQGGFGCSGLSLGSTPTGF